MDSNDCPLFLSSSSLPENFSSSNVLKVCGALVEADCPTDSDEHEQAESEAVCETTDIDENAPLSSSYYDSSDTDRSMMSHMHSDETQSKRKTHRRKVRASSSLTSKSRRSCGTEGGVGPSNRRRTVVRRKTRMNPMHAPSDRPRKSSSTSVGEVQAFMSLWSMQ